MGKKVITLSRALKLIVGLLAFITVFEFLTSFKTAQMFAFSLGVRTAELMSR